MEDKMKLDKWLKLSENAHIMVEDDEKSRAEYRFEKKKVYKRLKLWNGKDLKNVTLNGVGELSYDPTIKAIKLLENDDVEDLNPRPNCTISISLNHHDLSEYNRVRAKVYIKAVGFVNFYYHFSFGNDECRVTHAPSIVPNKWNDIMFEVEDIKRDNVKTLNITPFLFGTPPEALPDIEIYIKDLYMEKVDADYVEGWMTEDRIAYSHVGYFLKSNKVAITQNTNDEVFFLMNSKNEEVYQNKVQKVETSLGNFNLLDFSSFEEVGEYSIKVDNRKTNLFEISENPYKSSIWKSLQFLRTLRCGENVENVHSACHLNCRTVNKNGDSVPNFGGWHDAGDVSQFEICTAEMAQAILELYEKVKNTDKVLGKRLLEEARVGIDWLLRTAFSNGERALAVGYRIWRKNELKKDNTGVLGNVSEVGPFESFLASAALLQAAITFKDIDKIYSDWCFRTGIKDYETGVNAYNSGIYTKRWGTNIDSQVSGAAAVACSLLYQITKDEKYQLDGERFGKIIVSCQKQDYSNWEIPLRGYFYEDPLHTKMLTYEHRGHEQSPVVGLVFLLRTFKDSKDKTIWDNAVRLYAEYIKKTQNACYPYALMPAQVYELDKFNMERFTIPPSYGTKEEGLLNIKEQARHGIKLNDDVYLRRFPVAIQRRGYHATLLSKAKGVSIISSYLHDDELKQIVIDQLEWILGKNPFSTSTMYGEGYNYHPLYVAYSNQLVGALPVGFKTNGYNDAPYWPTVNNAVFKEIWGHTTGKYLWIFVDILDK